MAATPNAILDFYASPGPLTSAGRHAQLFDELPNDIAALTNVVQGLTLHRYMAAACRAISPNSGQAKTIFALWNG